MNTRGSKKEKEGKNKGKSSYQKDMKPSERLYFQLWEREKKKKKFTPVLFFLTMLFTTSPLRRINTSFHRTFFILFLLPFFSFDFLLFHSLFAVACKPVF